MSLLEEYWKSCSVKMRNIGSRADFFGNYPAGAANDPRAPYNQTDPEKRESGVDVSYMVSRTCNVTTTNYDEDEMLQPMEDYEENYDKPTDLFRFAREAAKLLLANHDYRLGSRWRLKRVIDSSTDWEITDREIDN